MYGRKLMVAACLMAVCLRGAAFAAIPAAASPSAPAAVTDDTELDEIVVTARLDSLSSLKLALIAAEDRFYERWNQLNDDDALDIYCRTEAPTGSRIARRTCGPRLIDDASHTQAMALFGGGGSGGNVKLTATGDLRELAAAELRRRTLPLLTTDPQLRQALLERAKLQQLYDSLRRERLRGKFAVWD